MKKYLIIFHLNCFEEVLDCIYINAETELTAINLFYNWFDFKYKGMRRYLLYSIKETSLIQEII